MVYLSDVEGTFVLPEPLPEKLFFLSAGSGITPVISMLRSPARRDALTDAVHVHCVRKPEDFIFGVMLRELAERHSGYTLVEHLSGEKGRITPDDLDEVCSDWRERDAFLSGPGELLDAMTERWEQEADPERLCTG